MGDSTTATSSLTTGKSTKSTFKSLFPAGYKIPTLPIDAVTKLKGQENYEDWAAHVEMMLDVYGATLIVCEGQTLDENANTEEQQMYRAVHAQARSLIINSMEMEI